MRTSVLLVHHGIYQPLWEQPGLIQVGTQISDSQQGLRITELSVAGLKKAMQRRGWSSNGVLIQYTDPFLSALLQYEASANGQDRDCSPGGFTSRIRSNRDPSGDCTAEPHDAVLLTFNPYLLGEVRRRLPMPVRCLAPTFFRYPAATPKPMPRLELLHVGSLGPHHPRRCELVQSLLRRQKIPFRHTTTQNAEEAAQLYSQHALVLNIPLNQDLNHRLFEVMAAGRPQVIFGNPNLLGENSKLMNRPDLFWTQSIDDLERLVNQLFLKPNKLLNIPVKAPPYWELKELLKKALAP